MSHNRIRELREAAGITLDELAKRSGYSKSQLSRLENEERRLNMDAMSAIGKALDVAPEELVAYGSLLPKNDEVTPDTVDGAPDVLADLRRSGLKRYRVEADSAALLGYHPGHTITVDERPEAVQSVKSLDIVIARVVGTNVKVLRQFIAPDMLITQRPSANMAVRLADRSAGLLILGVVMRNGGAGV